MPISEVFNEDNLIGMKRFPDTINDLQIGKAGEYLVCADLILNGYIAFPGEQGLPFDVIFEFKNRLFKVQVKTTRGEKHIPQRKTSIPAYIFHIGNNGKGNRRKKYDANQVDVFALVALDTRRIAYIPYFNTQTTMNFRIPEHRGKYHDEQGVILKAKVLELKASGMSAEEISKETGLKLSNVYRYSANVSIKQKGTNAGIYFNELTLNKCLNGLQQHKMV